jgi:pyridoxal phosphate enzyme (YggS family)
LSDRKAELAENLAKVRSKISSAAVTLIVVTKTYPVSDVRALHELGVHDFGENRNDEGVAKAQEVNATWHYQGEIQSRKIRELTSWAKVIHSLDDLSHATKISNAAASEIGIFLQLSLDEDPTRGGVSEAALYPLAELVVGLPNLALKGLMCVPPVGLDPQSAFAKIAAVQQRFQGTFTEATSLSAGMSGDFEMAIAHGATHIRVGSSILGSRVAR